MSADLKDALARTVIGQSRAIAGLSDCFQRWQAAASPRFPLCVLVSGPVSIGKEHLARALADARFERRIAVHTMRSDRLIRQNPRITQSRDRPGVLFVKMFDAGGQDLAVLDTLLSTGGLVLGNGDTMHFGDWVVMLSASQNYSETLAEAVRSDPAKGLEAELNTRFPWLVQALDGVVQLDPLAPEARMEVAYQMARQISVDHTAPMGLTVRAAKTLAEEEKPRKIGRKIRRAVAETGLSPDQRKALAERGQAFLIDCVNDTLCASICRATDLPVPKHYVDVPSPAPAPDFHLDPRQRPAHFPALDWRTEHRFDAFISYKFRKHHKRARALYKALKDMNFGIWFDAQQIGTPQDGAVEWSKDQLIERLVDGVGGSHTTIVFEAALEAIAFPPGYTEEQAEAEALARGSVMHADAGLVSWNWQKLEIDSSSRLITIRQEAGGFVVLHGATRLSHPTLGSGPFAFETVPAVVARALGRPGGPSDT